MTSKYISPPTSKETAIFETVTSQKDQQGASFINTVKGACGSVVDTATETIENMVSGVVDAATGVYDKISNQFSTTSGEINNQADHFKQNTDEALNDIELDEQMTLNCNMQGTLYSDATYKINNLSPKEIKTLKESPAMSTKLSNDLAVSGANKVKDSLI